VNAVGESRRLITASWLMGALVSWNIASVGAAATAVASHYRITLPAVGLFVTVMFAAQVFMQIPAGRLADRIGARNVGLLALVIVVLANLGPLVVPGLVAALAFRFVVGAGLGAGFVAGAAGVRAAGGASMAQGLYGGMAMAGAGAAIAVVGSLAPHLGWQAPFVTGAIVAALGVPFVLLAPNPAPHAPTDRPAVTAVLRDRRLARISLAQVVTFGFSVIIGNWAVPLLAIHGAGQAGAAGVGSLTLLGAVLGRPLGGWMTGRAPHWTRKIVATSMLTGGAGTLLLAAGGPVLLGLGGALLVGLSAGVPFGPIYHAAAVVRADAPGVAIAAVTLPAVVAILVGAPLVGVTFDLPGEGRIGFAVLGVCWALAAAVWPRRWDGE
jgi:MFS family permease